MTEGRAPTWATFSERGDRRPPPPARLPSGASFGERGDPRPLPPNRLGSTASTFSERDLTDVDTPPPPPPQFLASVEAAAKTAPGRTQLRAPSLDTALSVTDVDLGAVLLGDESSDDDDDYEAPAPYNQLQKQKKPPAPAPRSSRAVCQFEPLESHKPRFSRAVCQFEPLESQKNAERYVVKLQLIPDLSPRVTAYLERGDDAEVVPTPASGLRLVVEATGDADEHDAGPVSGWVVVHLARRRDVCDALSWGTGAEGGCVGVSWKCVFVTRSNAETCVEINNVDGGIATPSSRCSYGDDGASMAWGARN